MVNARIQNLWEGLMNRKFLAGMFLVIFGSAISSWAQGTRLGAIKAGRLFDSKSGNMLTNQVVLIEGDKISDVGSADKIQIPAGAQVIDLSQATVMPGFIDAHTHR